MRSKGFTLIELLITIVLIGIMTTVAMLAMGSGNQRDWQRQEAERLVQVCKLASQESIVQGVPIALEFFSHGYRFMIEHNGKWQPNMTDAIFRPTTLQAQLALTLALNKKPIVLSPSASVLAKPQIVFTPDGDSPLFEVSITLVNDDTVFIIANTLKQGMVLTTKPNNSRP